MERTLSSDLFFDHSQSTGSTGSSALPLRMLASVLLWQRRVVSRRQLARLDARLLADAGISEAQRHAELSKPFWR
ncbi:DUF1127 domain-containing protein [Pseudomonas anguilliseptica]|uniref:DUF1127 domain-containing protein n=1 Tax=Pseudomonas anguilliseptica TaxID=53406 RepID=UPI0037360350